MNAAQVRTLHSGGLDWAEYLATDPQKAEAWQAIYDRVNLTDTQQTLLSSFVREMHVVCVSGIWCGDCAQQGPLLQRIAEANDVIKLRWIDRDELGDLMETLMINAGKRVPVVLFAAEDDEPVSIAGDRTLTRYRAIAAKQLGAACPLPGAAIPDDELAGTLQDWLDEFERVHLLLRLSGRLREKHGD